MLIQLRNSAGLNQGAAFRTTRMDFHKISRIESGQVPSFLELQALLDLYGVTICDWKPYEEIWERAKERGWWERKRLRNVVYISDEHEAGIIRDFQPIYLPILLQTETYARRLLETTVPPFNGERMPVELEARARRRQLLDGDDPVHLHALIYQPVLHAGVDMEQLHHLCERAAQPNVTIQIITNLNGPRGDVEGSFTLMSFPDKDEPEVAHVNGRVRPTRTDNVEHVTMLRQAFESLAKHAMSPEDSLTYLADLSRRAPVEHSD